MDECAEFWAMLRKAARLRAKIMGDPIPAAPLLPASFAHGYRIVTNALYIRLPEGPVCLGMVRRPLTWVGETRERIQFVYYAPAIAKHFRHDERVHLLVGMSGGATWEAFATVSTFSVVAGNKDGEFKFCLEVKSVRQLSGP